MSDISAWSGTAASNNATPPDGAPENMAASGVNDCIREVMASVRRWYVDSEWVDWGHTPTRVDNDTFTVATDLTATYHAGRRLKVTGSATGYCTIASSSYSAPNTTVNVTMDSGNLPATLSAVYIAAMSYTNGSMPLVADGRLSSNVPLKNAANTFTAAQSVTTSSGITATLTNATGEYTLNQTDGTVSYRTYMNASGARVGTVGNHSWTVFTNGAGNDRLTVSGAGNVTISAPGSGGHVINTTSASGVQLVAAGSNVYLRFSNSGDANGFINYSGGEMQFQPANATRATLGTGLQLGSPTGGDKGAGTLNTAGAIYQNNVAVALSDALNASALTSGTVPDARFPATLPAASGANLTALNATNISSGTLDTARLPATINVATDVQINSVPIIASGSFTATLTGCTTSPTGTAYWSRAGNSVTLVLPSLIGTSNATTCTITGLPAGIQPATIANQAQRMGFFNDNGVHVSVFANIQDGSGTISFFRDNFANFTTSGSKGVGEGCVLTYLLT